MTVGQLRDALAKFNPDARLYVGGAGFAFKVRRVRYGNQYAEPDGSFVTVDDGERRQTA